MQRFREETMFKEGEKAGRIRDSISTYFACNPNYTLRLENSSSRLRRRPDPEGKKETGKVSPDEGNILIHTSLFPPVAEG